jgi:hypothetical protein
VAFPAAMVDFLRLAGVFDFPGEMAQREAVSPKERRHSLELLRNLIGDGWRPGDHVADDLIEGLTVDDPVYLILKAHNP